MRETVVIGSVIIAVYRLVDKMRSINIDHSCLGPKWCVLNDGPV